MDHLNELLKYSANEWNRNGWNRNALTFARIEQTTCWTKIIKESKGDKPLHKESLWRPIRYMLYVSTISVWEGLTKAISTSDSDVPQLVQTNSRHMCSLRYETYTVSDTFRYVLPQRGPGMRQDVLLLYCCTDTAHYAAGSVYRISRTMNKNIWTVQRNQGLISQDSTRLLHAA